MAPRYDVLRHHGMVLTALLCLNSKLMRDPVNRAMAVHRHCDKRVAPRQPKSEGAWKRICLESVGVAKTMQGDWEKIGRGATKVSGRS